ncbi:podocalyxin isoform X2 [Talpa occidentalis]|uniref:podocalyxin isoform X2 n=1 Tax=Talpa occidentalis TaxID=50954 RepID=UPI00188FF328|nr:podocalyxin isoform X2 [Talpa occidentalis]
MRSALARSALLLLLLLLAPPSRSQENESQPAKLPVTTVKATDPSKSNTSPASSTGNVMPSTGSPSTVQTSSAALNPVSSSPPAASSNPQVVGVLPSPSTTVVSGSTTQSPDSSGSLAVPGSPTAPPASGKTTPPPTTVPPQPEATTGQKGSKTAGSGTPSDHSAATTVAVKGPSVPTSQPPSPASSVPASVPSSMPASPALPTSGSPASKPPGSLTDQPGKTTIASSSSGTVVAPSATPQGMATMPIPSGTTSDNPQTSSKMPAVPATSSAITGSPSTGSQLPLVPSLGPGATPGRGPTDSTAQLPSTVPSDSSPSPTSTVGDHRIQCEPPERLNEKMLVLNLTNTGLCAGSPPDDKLVTLLCRAAKATFNPAQDQCHIQLAPILENQGLAIKEITIETKLLPQDVYELLKPKWDDLKEAGVNNMQLGDQGPPEETEDRFSMPLIITIVCMASFLLLVAALYGCCHQRLSQRKDQQRLTEELQTVENGYHDNPTLEVMETSSEMQEKKVVNLNGELGDSWIVPLDNLIKDDLDEEEDTHL